MFFRRAYHVYFLTNISKKVLYIGVTNNLPERLFEHYYNARFEKTSWAGKYNCYYLVYYEVFYHPGDAVYRERQLKKWRREKKEELVNRENPEWNFLNKDFLVWPPDEDRILREEW